jgi:electron transfer flavoprotein alpha subunit
MLFKRAFSSSSGRKVAVLLDLKEGKLNSSYENLFAAARKLSPKFSVLISTADEKEKVEKGNLFTQNNFPEGVEKILINCGESTAEQMTAIGEMKRFKGFSHILTVHDSFGKNCLPRIAGKISESILITDVLSIVENEEKKIEFERSIYAGNAIAKIEILSKSAIQLISIRSTAFSKDENMKIKDKIEVEIKESEKTTTTTATKLSKVIKREIIKSGRPELGSSAKVVVSGGRALKSEENFEKIIYPLADVLGAAVGASRAAVDAGYVSNDLQVGQTGKIVAPQLYIAIGISGAIQHIAGMKDSKVIVAINKDPECPIFKVADYGLIGDLFTLIPELTEKLKK